MSAARVGLPLARTLQVVGKDVALILAVPACTEKEFFTDPADGKEKFKCREMDPATAGLWVVRRDPEHPDAGLSYTKVPYPEPDLAGCAAAEFFQLDDVFNGRQSLSLHPDSLGAAEGDRVRAFMSSRHADCGVVEVTFTLGDEAADHEWSMLDLDSDPDCNLGTGPGVVPYLNGVYAARDGRWLFAYGGQPSKGMTIDAICAVDLASAESGGAYNIERVATNATVEFEIHAFTSHPHVGALWYFGGWGSAACDNCKAPGLYALQRRRKWKGASYGWTWGFTRVSDDDLEVQVVKDIDLGPGLGGRTDPITTLYVTGMSWWDGKAAW
jgi:hypothetical protein